MELETEREGFLIRERARAYGSQGQQRTIALALKLAEVELIRERTGSPPLVLLDDVVSELDDKRAAFLLDVLQQVNAQTFITSTQQCELLHHLDEASGFHSGEWTSFLLFARRSIRGVGAMTRLCVTRH